MFMPEWYDYAIFYPDVDEPDYDGIHSGGLKGIRDDAPQKAKDAYEEFLRQEAKAKEEGVLCYL